MHIGAHRSILPDILTHTGYLPAAFAQNGDTIEAGHIYVAPPDCHMLIDTVNIHLRRGPKVHFTRPAADPLFISAAEAWRDHVMGIVLSGGDSDGTAGLRAIGKHGGKAYVQDPSEAEIPDMPRSAIIRDHPDACYSVEELARQVIGFCRSLRSTD